VRRKHNGRRIDALLRPEDVAIEVDPDAKGFVTHRSFLGSTTRVVVQVGEISVRVDVRSEVAADIELGTHVHPTSFRATCWLLHVSRRGVGLQLTRPRPGCPRPGASRLSARLTGLARPAVSASR